MPKASFRWICWIVVAIAWAWAVRFLIYRFYFASDFPTQLSSVCALAVLLLWFWQRERLLYGVLECSAAVLLLSYAAGTGRGPFGHALSADFDRFDPQAITWQAYGALLLLIDGLSNVAKGWVTWPPRGGDLLQTARRFSRWLAAHGHTRRAPPTKDPPGRGDLP